MPNTVYYTITLTPDPDNTCFHSFVAVKLVNDPTEIHHLVAFANSLKQLQENVESLINCFLEDRMCPPPKDDYYKEFKYENKEPKNRDIDLYYNFIDDNAIWV